MCPGLRVRILLPLSRLIPVRACPYSTSKWKSDMKYSINVYNTDPTNTNQDQWMNLVDTLSITGFQVMLLCIQLHRAIVCPVPQTGLVLSSTQKQIIFPRQHKDLYSQEGLQRTRHSVLWDKSSCRNIQHKVAGEMWSPSLKTQRWGHPRQDAAGCTYTLINTHNETFRDTNTCKLHISGPSYLRIRTWRKPTQLQQIACKSYTRSQEYSP